MPLVELPPVFGTKFMIGPLVSDSPSPPVVVMFTSAELPGSVIRPDVVPASDAPCGIPSTKTRPSPVCPCNPKVHAPHGPVATSALVTATPGISTISALYDRPVGMAATTSSVSTCCRFALCTSTTGESPVTVTVSSRLPTWKSALTVATKVPASSIPSRLTVRKPVNVKLTW